MESRVRTFIVSSLFSVEGNLFNLNDKYHWYEKMRSISDRSFKNSFPDAEHITFEGRYQNSNHAFKDVFIKTYKLWKENAPCNILFHDLDSLCLKEFPVFEISDHFAMFNVAPANPKKEFPIYRVCSLRYFPHNMNEKLFEFGLEEWNKFDLNSNVWDHEQVIYNRILYHPLNNLQNHRQFLKPEWNYFLLNDSIVVNTQNGYSEEDASVLQMCATRGHQEVYQKMLNLTRIWKTPSLLQDLSLLNSKLMDSLSEKGLQRKIIGNLFYKHYDGDITLCQINQVFETKRQRLAVVARRCKNGLEIGISGGHSVLLMLNVNPRLKLIGNDLAEHIPASDMCSYNPEIYVPVAAQFLTQHFPERFEFVKGDCLKVIPKLVEKLKAEGKTLDLAHIDGAKHTYYQDFYNLASILEKDAYVIFDDTEMCEVQNTVNRLLNEGRLRRDPEFPPMSNSESQRHEVLRFVN